MRFHTSCPQHRAGSLLSFEVCGASIPQLILANINMFTVIIKQYALYSIYSTDYSYNNNVRAQKRFVYNMKTPHNPLSLLMSLASPFCPILWCLRAFTKVLQVGMPLFSTWSSRRSQAAITLSRKMSDSFMFSTFR